MAGEERERDPFQPEADTGGVRHRAVFEMKAPFRAEGVLVIVEAHAGGGLGRRGDGDQKLEFQILVALVVGEHAAGPAEERVVGHVDRHVEPDLGHHLQPSVHPCLAEGRDMVLRSHADIFAHAEELLAGRIVGGLVAEAVGLQVVEPAAGRQAAAPGDGRIERIAGRRRQHDIGRLLALRPVAVHFHALQQAHVVEFAAAEAVHGAGKLRKALHVAAGFEMGAVHARRKAHRLRAIGSAIGVDQPLEAGDHVLEPAGAAIKTLDAGVDQEARVEQAVEKRGLHIHRITPSGWCLACERAAWSTYCRECGRWRS